MTEFPYAHFRSESALETGVRIWQICSPVLIVFGTFGNVMSIIVLSRRKFNKWSSTVFLIGLAAADLSVLYIGLVRQWFKYTFDLDVRFISPFFCKVHWWLMYCCADMSVWMLTTVTVERLICTLCATKSKNLCTVVRAKMVVVFIIVLSFLMNSHLLYGFGELRIPLDNNQTLIIPCAPLTDEYDKFFSSVWTWLDLCKFSIIPFVILCFGNICIIWKVTSTERKARCQIGPSAGFAQSQSKRTSSMSKLLVLLNFVFIICTSPVCIYFIGEPYWIPKDVPRNIQLQDPWWALVNMLMYCNSSANFILYCVTGTRFREELKKSLSFAKIRRVEMAVSTVTTAHQRTGLSI